LDNREYQVALRKKESLKATANEGNLSKPDMPRILLKARCQRLTGQIKLNGEVVMLTQAEVQRIINQINESFKEDRQRLEKLEARVKQLEAVKPASKSKKEAEQWTESTK
jgi:tRNA(Phe) wybutosine-synthesizing methylase Tyw3